MATELANRRPRPAALLLRLADVSYGLEQAVRVNPLPIHAAVESAAVDAVGVVHAVRLTRRKVAESAPVRRAPASVPGEELHLDVDAATPNPDRLVAYVARAVPDQAALGRRLAEPFLQELVLARGLHADELQVRRHGKTRLRGE